MATWENVGKIQGEKGEKGERGERGEKGDPAKPQIIERNVTETEIYTKYADGTYEQEGHFSISTPINVKINDNLYRSTDIEIIPPLHGVDSVISNAKTLSRSGYTNTWLSNRSNFSYYWIRLLSVSEREDISYTISYRYVGVWDNE